MIALVEIGQATRRGGMNVLHRFVAETDMGERVLYHYLQERYSGFSIRITKSLPVMMYKPAEISKPEPKPETPPAETPKRYENYEGVIEIHNLQNLVPERYQHKIIALEKERNVLMADMDKKVIDFIETAHPHLRVPNSKYADLIEYSRSSNGVAYTAKIRITTKTRISVASIDVPEEVAHD